MEAGPAVAQAQGDLPFKAEPVASFDEPWAMAFLPDGRMLVTKKKGVLRIVTRAGQKSSPVGGVPDVDYGGQGGLGDVALHPRFGDNRLVYLSYVELFDDKGFLWISSGERQKFAPVQDMQSNLGKILRLRDDGSVPEDNPFVGYAERDALVDDEGVYGQVWSLGHRNPLGIALDLAGRLWEIEMGPAGGDELNRIERGANYGYPVVSNGDHYDGREIPDHDTRPEFRAPDTWWTPVISPGSLVFYRGGLFEGWRGNALAGGLSSRAIVRIAIDGDEAREVGRSKRTVS